MITLSNADAALKEYYLDAVSKTLNEDVSPFFNAIEKTTANVYGKDVKMSIVKNNINNVVAGDEDGDLPTPYGNRYVSVTMPLKNIYGTIEISDKAIRASRDSSGAFVDLLNAEMEGLVSSAKSNFARMLFGDGNGYICSVEAQKTTTDYEVTSARGFFSGLVVDIVNAAGETLVSEAKITTVDFRTNLIRLDKSVTAGSVNKGARVLIHGVTGKELSGLTYLTENNQIYGYDRLNDPLFRCQILSVNRTDFNSESIFKMLDMIENMGEGKPNMILCSPKTKNAIADMFADKVRFVNTTEMNLGATSVFVNEIPVYGDKYCQDDRVYFLNTDDFVLCQLCDWEWLESEDGKILKQVAGKAAYSATLVKYAELICKNIAGQGFLKISG